MMIEREELFVSNGTKLYGTLSIPDGAERVPAVLFIHGSFPQTRDGDVDSSNTEWFPNPIPGRRLITHFEDVTERPGQPEPVLPEGDIGAHDDPVPHPGPETEAPAQLQIAEVDVGLPRNDVYHRLPLPYPVFCPPGEAVYVLFPVYLLSGLISFYIRRLPGGVLLEV